MLTRKRIIAAAVVWTVTTLGFWLMVPVTVHWRRFSAADVIVYMWTNWYFQIIYLYGWPKVRPAPGMRTALWFSVGSVLGGVVLVLALRWGLLECPHCP